MLHNLILRFEKLKMCLINLVCKLCFFGPSSKMSWYERKCYFDVLNFGGNFLANMILQIHYLLDEVFQILILAMLPLNLCFSYNLTTVVKQLLNLSQKTYIIQLLKGVSSIHFDILHKTKKYK